MITATTIIVVIRDSRSICSEMVTWSPICDGDTINIGGVDVICSNPEAISGVVLVSPCLSTDLAVVDAINRVCNTGTSWSCESWSCTLSTQLGRCVDLSK